MRIAVFRTRKPEDIEVFDLNHYRVRFRPDLPEDGDLEVIIRHHHGEWWIKVEDDEEFWCYYDQDDINGIWTWMDDANQELFVIRGVEAN